MSLNSTISEVYFELANARPCWTLIIFASIYTTLAIVGIFLNLSVIYVTIRTKSMNKSANKLLAIYSFFEIVHQSGHFLFAYSVISGQYLMPYKTVIQILTPSYFAVSCTLFLLFLTSIDRLIAVIFPLRQSENVLFYIITLPFIGLCNVLYLYSQSCDSVDKTLVTVTLGDIGMASYQCANSPEFIWPTIISLILLSTIVLYAVVAIAIYFRKSPPNSNSHQFNTRIFRSLFCIVSMNIGGYLLNYSYIIIIPMLGNEMSIWKWSQIFGILLNISAASNAPILYFTSTEYRKAFDKEWQRITNAFNRNSVYLELANARPRWTLIIFASIYTILAIVGIFLNLSVIYVTLRTKSLNNSANKLLAIYSFFEIVHQSGHFLFAYSVISGQYLMPYKTVIQILTPSYFAVSCTLFLLFLTSIDRLIAVIFPLRQSENVLFYIITLPFIGLCNVLYLYSQSCDSVDKTLVTVTLGDIGMASYQCINSLEFIWPTIINGMLLTTIVFYVVVAIAIYFRKSPPNSNSHQFNIRIFRSLFCIVSMNIGGYLLNYFYIIIIPMLGNNQMAIWKWSQIFGILLNISATSNAPILYFTSTDYRKAFDKKWQTIINLFNRNAVQPY
uniref:G-protein coupled receptors family 1 profile domain-containing protein n=1 Tax=Globodera rostochiensis TaxID=31243 RepID=A0A914HGA1_GLORO